MLSTYKVSVIFIISKKSCLCGRQYRVTVMVNVAEIRKGSTVLNGSLPEGVGRGSPVGIANGYGLDGPEIESRWRTRFSVPVQTGSGAHPGPCTIGTGSFPEAKSDRGVTPTAHPLLVPWSRKSRAIPLLLLWAVRPVQCLSACTSLHVTFLPS